MNDKSVLVSPQNSIMTKEDFEKGRRAQFEGGGSTIRLEGAWWDEIYDSRGNLIEKTPVVRNLITVNAGVLLAGLLANDGDFNGGILYLAVGEGDAAWDTLPIAPSYSDTTLFDEVGRIAPDSIAYVDAVGDPVAGKSNYILVKTTIPQVVPFNDTYLREMGLFGGEATAVLDSGQMLDAIRHTRRYKTSAFSMIRYIRLGL